MNNFQTILVAIFLAFFVFGVLIFSGLLKIGGSSNTTTTPQGKLVIWGTLNSSDFYKVFENAVGQNRNLNVNYIPKQQSTYEQSLIEAFANGTGPDLFIMSPDMISKFNKFVYKIPYVSYPERTYRDTFIDGADIYLSYDGVIGYPLAVDPVVMYYNKNIFSNEGISQIPQYWNELFDLSNRLTKKKNDGTIMQSMIALGRYDNVSNSKDILATLFMQSGNTIIKRVDTENSTRYTPILNDISSATNPVEMVLNFFVEFSNPSNSAYSWNRSLPNSIDMFTGGKSAIYIGKASELFKIESVNPNLSFDIAQVLQTKGSNTKTTYGDIYAVSVNKKSTNITAALGFAGLLSNDENASNFAKSLALPPVSRSLLSVKPTDPYLSTFFNSAIFSKSWVDPSSKESDIIFNEMINNILSNKLSVIEAITKTQGQLEQIINK
jgi:ABC-type glycerol-3-phosphate transport system substrate-binding protein